MVYVLEKGNKNGSFHKTRKAAINNSHEYASKVKAFSAAKRVHNAGFAVAVSKVDSRLNSRTVLQRQKSKKHGGNFGKF